MTPTDIVWERVTSSHISRIAYQAEESQILVEFNTGDIWAYSGDAEDWRNFQTAASKGRYLHYFLKGKGRPLS